MRQSKLLNELASARLKAKYTTATYVVNYKLLVEKILDMNPDVEIILVGLLNTTYGMNVVDENGIVLLPFGDVMDTLFDILNVYMAGLPVWPAGRLVQN